MSLSSYSDVIAKVGLWLGRSDLASEIDTAIALVEADGNREFRTRNMLATVTLTTVAGTSSLTLPTDFLELFHLERSVAPKFLSFWTRDQVIQNYPSNLAGPPVAFTGGATTTIGVAPIPDAAHSLDLRYYQAIPNLNATTATNWLLTAHPNVYLFGCMTYLGMYLDDQGKVQAAGALYEKGKQDVKNFDQRARVIGPGMTAMVRGSTP